MRLFTAIELPEPVGKHLADLNAHLKALWLAEGCGRTGGRAEEFRSRLSYMRQENLHVTLTFLGEVHDGRIPEICRGLAEVKADPATPLFADRAELLPPRGPVRVVAVGLGGDDGAMRRLHRAVEGRCADLGFAPERREFRPHITIARARNPLRVALRDRLKDVLGSRLPGPNFAAAEFVLMESRLKPTGAEYTAVARFPLIGNPGTLGG